MNYSNTSGASSSGAAAMESMPPSIVMTQSSFTPPSRPTSLPGEAADTNPGSASTSSTVSKADDYDDDIWRAFFQLRNYTNPLVMDQLSNIGFTHHELLNMKGATYDYISGIFQTLLGPQHGASRIVVISNAVLSATTDDWKILEEC